MLGAEECANAFLFDVGIVFFEVGGEVKSDDGEAGVVISTRFVAAVGWGLEFFGVLEDVLAFWSVDVADAGVPACCFKGLAQKTGVRPVCGTSALLT